MKFLIKNCFCIVLSVMFTFAVANSKSFKLKINNMPETEKTTDEPDIIDKIELKLPDGFYYTEDETYYYKSGIMQTGWQEIKGQKYYFSVKTGVALKGKHKIGNSVYYFGQNGTMSKGWVKIHGHKYYFSEKTGTMQTNCIVGTKDTKFYYVDENGIQVTAPEIKAAVEYVKKYTKNKQTSDVKLWKCYQALRNNYRYQSSQDTPTVKKLSEYAYNLLTYGKGNCYRYAAAFTCIAKVLGYKSRINIGKVSSRYGGMAAHGWAEVKSDDIWHKCDVNMNLYMHTGKTSKKYKYLEKYKLVIENGNVVWK